MPVKKTVTAAAACLMFILSATVCSMAFLSAGSQKDIKIREASAGNERVIIVIDPGHGGMDGGASAADGTDEKNINLAISLYLKKMMEEYPVDVIMTRTEDEMLSDGADSIKSIKAERLLQYPFTLTVSEKMHQYTEHRFFIRKRSSCEQKGEQTNKHLRYLQKLSRKPLKTTSPTVGSAVP